MTAPIYPDLSRGELAQLKLALMDYAEARSEGRDTNDMEVVLERWLARVPVQHLPEIQAFVRELELAVIKDCGGGQS